MPIGTFACVLTCIHLSLLNCLSDLSVRYIFILWLQFQETRFIYFVFVDIARYLVPKEIKECRVWDIVLKGARGCAVRVANLARRLRRGGSRQGDRGRGMPATEPSPWWPTSAPAATAATAAPTTLCLNEAVHKYLIFFLITLTFIILKVERFFIVIVWIFNENRSSA